MVASQRKVAAAVSSQVNARGLQFECTRVLRVGKCADSRSAGRPRKRLINTMYCGKEKKKVCMSGRQGEWCMIGVNGGTF